jgi:geranylgeranyl diphosphate synthase type II
VFELEAYLKQRAALIERALADSVPASNGPAARLSEAMRYSLLDGGKRLRPILALASSEAVGGTIEDAIAFACAVEMIHTYSMVHDDLPCMDNDDLRHGKPTNHKVYGDALATLVGDALLTDAFGVLARALAARSPAMAAATIAELSEAAGSAGMVAGQVIDLLGEGRTMNLEQLEYLHSKKTGALFLVSVRGGARLGGATPAQLESLTTYARALGLCFQVVDDLLDVEASTEQMGKRTQKDHAAGKNTYPGIIGIEDSRTLARDLERRAIAAIASLRDRAEALRAIASFVVERKQ